MGIKVCLDAGHYGFYNRSPVNRAYYESVMTWKLTNMLGNELLKYPDIQVIKTRANQAIDLALEKRGNCAKGCDLFISLHSNATSAEYVDYPVVYRAFDNLNNADKLGLVLAQGIAEVMGTAQTGRTSTRSYVNGGRTYEYYGVLRGARAVGCPLFYIIEHSFHTNLRSTNWLLVDANLQRLAVMEARKIAEHYGLVKGQADSKPDYPDTPSTGGGIGMVYMKYDLNQRNKPDLQNSKVVNTAKAGYTYTVMNKIAGNARDGIDWYLMKNGTYMSAHEYYSTYTPKNQSNYDEWVGSVNCSALNVRTGPGTNYGKLSAWPQLGRDNLILVQGEAKGSDVATWYKILIADKYVGYVHSAYID